MKSFMQFGCTVFFSLHFYGLHLPETTSRETERKDEEGKFASKSVFKNICHFLASGGPQ
jgi:hypothetical protein